MASKELNFRQYFFKIYDAKIQSGLISFSQTGISKNVFNQLCNDREFVPSLEFIDSIKEGMKLTDEEFNTMKSYLEVK